MTPDWILVIEQVQQAYVREYAEFCRQQMQQVEGGSPEVAFELSENSTVLRRLYRVDFASNDNGTPRMIEMDHPAMVQIPAFETPADGIQVEINSFRWSGVVLRMEGASWDEATVLPWFDDWFGLESGREADAMPGEPGGMIHSAHIEGQDLNVDFGSAPADSLIQLIDIARQSGASSIEILDGLSLNEGAIE